MYLHSFYWGWKNFQNNPSLTLWNTNQNSRNEYQTTKFLKHDSFEVKNDTNDGIMPRSKTPTIRSLNYEVSDFFKNGQK